MSSMVKNALIMGKEAKRPIKNCNVPHQELHMPSRHLGYFHHFDPKLPRTHRQSLPFGTCHQTKPWWCLLSVGRCFLCKDPSVLSDFMLEWAWYETTQRTIIIKRPFVESRPFVENRPWHCQESQMDLQWWLTFLDHYQHAWLIVVPQTWHYSYHVWWRQHCRNYRGIWERDEPPSARGSHREKVIRGPSRGISKTEY